MTFLLDHLIAIVVGTVLLGALLILQQRGQQSAIEATQRYRAQAMASEMTGVLEREIENIRSRAETERTFASSPAAGDAGPGTYRFRLRRDPTDAYTTVFEFPTTTDPNSLGASGTMIVGYHTAPTGQTIQIDGADRPLLRVTRYQYERGGDVVQTGVYDRVVDIDVTALTDGGEEDEGEGLDAPPRVSLTVRFAPELTPLRAADQGAAPLHSIRYARSIRIPAASAAPGTSPVDMTVAGGIPDDFPAVAVVPAPSGGGSGGSTPPGHGGTPPGQGGTPPGQGSTSPGQGGTPPGNGNGNANGHG